MEEVIAKKANLLPGYIAVAVLAVIFIVAGIVLGMSEETAGALVIGIAVGGILGVTAGVQIFRTSKLPKVYITYSEGKFHFADGTSCLPSEITHILLKITRGRYGSTASTGGIVITINDRRQLEYKYVSKIKYVEKRINEICNGGRG